MHRYFGVELNACIELNKRYDDVPTTELINHNIVRALQKNKVFRHIYWQKNVLQTISLKTVGLFVLKTLPTSL